MRTPQMPMAVFEERRKRISEKMKGSAFIIAANPEYLRNNDVHYSYRQDSNMVYFTGYEEPNSVFVFRPGRTPEATMFVMPRDPEMETWNGFRYGVDGAKKDFHMDATYPIETLRTELPKLLKDVDQVYYSMFIDRKMDQLLLELVEQNTWSRSRSNKGNLAIVDPRAIIGEMRLRKTAVEVEWHKRACEISAEAHVELMKAARPGMNERALHGVFLRAIMERGSPREGYGSIVATGANATTLHYVYNDQVCKDGDLVLVDAGGEYNYYSGDITRVFPINGKFNETQKRVYQRVLDVQKHLVAMVKPGISRDTLQKETISKLVDVMIEEKLLKGRKEDIIEKREFAKFYMHGVSHWLGMDVHDAGLIEVNGEPRPLETGFVITVEPGLYVPQDAPGVPEALRGLGIRIEDDILVTENGHENMTIKAPKEIADIEAVMVKR